MTDRSGPTHIRGTHHACFRSGDWAKLYGTTEIDGRECYLVRFPDGASDWWVVDDPAAGYEFKTEAERVA